LEVVASLEIVKRSSIIQIELHERLARYHGLTGRPDIAADHAREAQRLCAIEQVAT